RGEAGRRRQAGGDGDADDGQGLARVRQPGRPGGPGGGADDGDGRQGEAGGRAGRVPQGHGGRGQGGRQVPDGGGDGDDQGDGAPGEGRRGAAGGGGEVSGVYEAAVFAAGDGEGDGAVSPTGAVRWRLSNPTRARTGCSDSSSAVTAPMFPSDSRATRGIRT